MPVRADRPDRSIGKLIAAQFLRNLVAAMLAPFTPCLSTTAYNNGSPRGECPRTQGHVNRMIEEPALPPATPGCAQPETPKIVMATQFWFAGISTI